MFRGKNMNKVIIEIPQFMDITIRVNNIREAISQLLKFYPSQKCRTSDSISRFRGIAKFKSDFNEEEWYEQ